VANEVAAAEVAVEALQVVAEVQLVGMDSMVALAAERAAGKPPWNL